MAEAPLSHHQRSQTNSSGHRAARHSEGIIIGLVTLCALLLRLWNLDGQSLWYDEGWSIHLARQPVGEIIPLMIRHGSTHPPGYFLLLHGWTLLFGKNAVAWRGLSALLGAASVPALYGLGRRLYGSRSGVVAALLLAICPSHVLYSREARMYPLLLLILIGLLWLYYDLSERLGRLQASRWRWWHWVLLAALQALAMYTHYFAILALAPLIACLLVQLYLSWRSDRVTRHDIRIRFIWWMLVQVAVGAAFSLWVPVAFQLSKTHRPWRARPPDLKRFVVETWTFLQGGHIALRGREPLFARLALASLGAFVLLLIVVILSDPKRHASLFLTVQGAASACLVFVLMRIRPGYHPRYLLIGLVPMLLLMARGLCMIWRWQTAPHGVMLGPAIAVGTATLWLSTYASAAWSLAGDPYYVRDDARGTSRYLGATLPQGAMVWSDHVDWALSYYFEEVDLRYRALDIGSYDSDPVAELSASLEGQTKVALIRWHQGTADHRGLLAHLLERWGTLIHREYISGYLALIYEVDPDAVPPRAGQPDASFGPLRLTRFTADARAPADEALSVSLAWHVDGAMSNDLKAIVELVDQKGRRLAWSDSSLMDSLGRGTSAWASGSETTTYHTLNLASDLAPLTYALQLGLYSEADLLGLDLRDRAGAPAGKRLALGDSQLTRPQGRSEKRRRREALGLVAQAQPMALAPGLELRAASRPDGSIETGETLTVLLEWARTSEQPLGDHAVELALVRDGAVLAVSMGEPVYGRYPTGQWALGQTVIEWRDLVVPPTAKSGAAEVQVRIVGGEALSLGAVQVRQTERIYGPPASEIQVEMEIGGLATLVGYDLSEQRLRAGQPLTLDLYWRAQRRSEQPLTVFAHLLDERGQLIAQHDSPPANGQRPTVGWLKGEYIADVHTLRWVAESSPGRGTIEVGFYDPQSGDRLLNPDGESRLLLPTSIEVR